MEIEPAASQYQAITYPQGPLLILAGAGTGKTSTLILRIEHMIHKGLWEPRHVVLLTFTDRARDDLVHRVREELGNIAEEIAISTFHRFCNRLVREYGSSPDAEKLLLQEDDITFLLLNRFDELTFLQSHSFKTDPVSAVTKSFVPFFNRIRDELISPTELELKLSRTELTADFLTTQFPGISDRVETDEYLRQFRDLVRVYRSYQAWKQELGVVDYGDMILDCWEMLNGDLDTINLVRHQFRHIVIDEYQDNNYALNRIAAVIMGDRPDITVVGDEDQCIYSFRGANYYNIRDFRNKYGTEENHGEIALEDNHRSTQEILDVANLSIAHDKNRTPKMLRSSTKRRGPKTAWHVGERREMLTGIPSLVNGLIRWGKHFGDIAVLCRTWNHVDEVAQALQRASIPTDVFVERFFSVREIRDVLAWAHLICGDSKAEMSLFRLLTDYLGRQFAESFFRAYDARIHEDLVESLNAFVSKTDLLPTENERLTEFLEKIEVLRRELKQNRPADEMVWEILSVTDLLKHVRRNYRYAHRLALANVGHLLSLAESFSLREDPKTVDRWLRYMSVLALQGNRHAIQPEFHDTSIATQVMTVHGSKGLQFPVVIIPFLRSGSFPINYSPSGSIDRLPDEWYNWPRPEGLTPREEHLNEERRIFYVAATRAMEELHLFGPEKAQSVFLKEILNETYEYVERQDMKEQQTLRSRNSKSVLKQRLLVELNRELSAHQYANAHTIIDAIGIVEETGGLPEGHAYSRMISDTSSIADRETAETGETVSLSASRVEQYDTCPYKYRLSKVDGVPERKSRVQMEFGIIIHNVLEEFHESQDQSLELLSSLLEKHWRQESFEYSIREEEFKSQGIQLLTDYFKFFQPTRPDILATEANFDFTLPDMSVRIVGKIDRIDREGDSLTVIDYKTSKNKEKAKTSLQLALYTEAIRRNAVEGVTGEAGSAYFHFLRHPEDPIESHIFEERDLKIQMRKVGKVASGIRKREFEPKTGWHCNTCDYRDFLCPAWEEK